MINLNTKIQTGLLAAITSLISSIAILSPCVSRADNDEALQKAVAIMQNEKAGLPSRIRAAAEVAAPLIEKRDFDGAEALLRQTLSFKRLNERAVFLALERIGHIYLLQDKLDEALQIYKEAYNYFATALMSNNVARLSANALRDSLRFDDASAVWLKNGNRLEAAAVYETSPAPYPEKARAMRLQILEDEAAPLAERAAAGLFFFTSHPQDLPIAQKYHEMIINADTNQAAKTLTSLITKRADSTAYFGDYAGTVRYLEWLSPLIKGEFDFITAVSGVNAYAHLHDFDKAIALAESRAAAEILKPTERYQLGMTAEALKLREMKNDDDLAQRLIKAEAILASELKPSSEERAEALNAVGTTVLHANYENLTHAVITLRDTLYKDKPPRKRYKVGYSTTPITGIHSWNAAASATERQLIDRPFGGSMEFLVTDVATGDRGGGISTEESESADFRFTEVSFISDMNGLHIRYDAHDPEARSVEAKLLAAGSYESYIAPGANQPYICILANIQANTIRFWNTTYNNLNHQRIRSEDTHLWRNEWQFSDTGYTTYIFLSWEAYADKLPERGDVWDFENAHWGRLGRYTWNGLESIHGRSSWGELEFEIPSDGMLAIKRKLIFTALASYNHEKSTSQNHEGVLDHWADDSVGDPVFYAERIAPLVERLDSYIPKVDPDMDAATIEEVFNEAHFGWRNIRHMIAEERRVYLKEKIAKGR